MRVEEFEVEKAWWANRKESEQSWKVSATDIAKNNYNLDIKNPNAPLEIHDNPDILLEEFSKLAGNVKQLQDDLLSILNKSLGK
jgi:type I restriction enzyme M protein